MVKKKPVRSTKIKTVVEAPATSLMSTQDTKRKGDSTAQPRNKDKMVTMWVTEEQKNEMKLYAAAHNMSVARLIQEGVEMRMKLD